MNKKIVLSMVLLMFGLSTLSAQRTVTGTVISSDDNLGIPGASVVVKGSNPLIGTVTDFDGRFSISVPNDLTTLVFSFTGMATEERDVMGMSSITVTMGLTATNLDAVVVIGYGSQRRREVTGAVSSIQAADFNSGVRNSPIGLLQGQVAGLTIQRSGSDPTNTGFAIQIRGFSTLDRGAGTSPLFVVDGIPVSSIDNISPNDILSMDVLKDGSAAAIYGTRGTNGVILITTRRGPGVQQTVPTTVEYSGFASISTRIKRTGMSTPSEFRNLATLSNDKFFPTIYTDHNTDWMKEVTHPVALTHQHNIAMSGASKGMSYRGSLNYKNSEGIARNNERQEFIGNLAMDQTALDGWLKIQYDLSYMNYRNNYFTGSFEMAAILNPTFPVLDPTSESGYFFVEETGRNNPVERMNNIESHQTGNYFRGSIRPTVTIKPIPGLRVGGFAAFEEGMNWNYWYNGVLNRDVQNSNLAGIRPNHNRNRLFEATADYANDCGPPNIVAVTGLSFQKFDYSGHDLRNGGFPTSLIKYYSIGEGDLASTPGSRMQVGSYRNSNALAGVFGRVNYMYDEKYMFSASIRREGSSRFGANNKWGNFPALSAGWNMMKEDFMKPYTFLNDLRVRFGFGVTGNDLSQNLRSMEIYSDGGMFWYNGEWVRTYTVAQNPNPDLRWEKKYEYNLGVDFAMFSNRVYGTIDAYIRNTKDLLWDYKVPQPPYEHDRLLANAGAMTSKGIELTLSVVPVRNRNFTWISTPTIAFNNNKITKLSDPSKGFNYEEMRTGEIHGNGIMGLQTQILIEGQSVGTWWGYKYRIDPATGRRVYQTEDGRWTTDPTAGLVPGKIQKLGNAQPLFTYGWNNVMRHKNWDLTMLFRGCVGSKLFNMTRMAYAPEESNSMNVFMKDVAGGFEKASSFFSDFYLEDGSYIKLDNLTLGYNIPVKTNNYIRSARAYFTAQNVFTITGYSGRDPEVNTTSVWNSGIDYVGFYPIVRNFVLGVNLTFN
jgi:TonB-linked SusC/RagA family outer membrane protein